MKKSFIHIENEEVTVEGMTNSEIITAWCMLTNAICSNLSISFDSLIDYGKKLSDQGQDND